MYNIKILTYKIFAREVVSPSRPREQLAGLGQIQGKPLSLGTG